MINTKAYILFLVSACSFISVSAQVRDSLDIKIGQMILIGMPKAEVDSSVIADIRAGKVGTILFFEKNVPKTSTAFAPLKKMIWTYQKAATIPLFVAIDQEGGRVNRLKDKYGFPRSITAKEMGKSKTLDSVRFYAEAIASNLAGLGFNVNFAPVVDVTVSSNPNNPIFATGRSFSSNADTVTLMAREYIKQHRKFGVITVLKHFPGHGSSQADTHFGLADVTEFWKDYELSPYRSLIEQGYADAIMSAHIVNKKLEPAAYPGTLSKRVLDSLLRKKMNFNGVVFSDDMQMHAITKMYSLDQSVKLAINSGIDILCFSNNIPNSEERTVDKVHSIIRQAVGKGEISSERINQSFQRIMQLKKRLNGNESDVIANELNLKQREIDILRQKLEEEKMKSKTPDSTQSKPEDKKVEKKSKRKKKKD
jgi:beta-N-acetylhexosaminidase